MAAFVLLFGRETCFCFCIGRVMVFEKRIGLVCGAIRLQETELILVGVLTITTVVVYLNIFMGMAGQRHVVRLGHCDAINLFMPSSFNNYYIPSPMCS